MNTKKKTPKMRGGAGADGRYLITGKWSKDIENRRLLKDLSASTTERGNLR